MSSNEVASELKATESWTQGQQLALQDVRRRRQLGHRWALLVNGVFYTLDDDGLRPSVTDHELMQGPLDVASAKPIGEMAWMHNSIVQLKAYDLGPSTP